MPSRAVTSFLPRKGKNYEKIYLYVSMPSRAVTSFLLGQDDDLWKVIETDVSMPSRAVTSFLLRDNNDEYEPAGPCVNALSGCYLISTSPKMPWNGYYRSVSMPSRAVTSFLQYHFKNLGFMRLPEPVFAGIYQNILTTAVFRAC